MNYSRVVSDVRAVDAYEGARGPISREKISGLIELRAVALSAIRESFQAEAATEVTTASLVNVAGSCENPYASFPLEFYGGEAYLSQSAQLQLEPLVLRLRRAFFTFASSFRAESYDDPESKGRRLSEFSLAEIELPLESANYDVAAAELMGVVERTIRCVVKRSISLAAPHIEVLGGSLKRLEKTVSKPFSVLDWRDARRLLQRNDLNLPDDGDLTMKHERVILREHGYAPVFVVGHHPSQKFFNTKRNGDHCYSFDLLLPPLGENVGGALREENLSVTRSQLLESAVAKFIQDRNGVPEEAFQAYFEVLQTEPPLLRGGFGIGFERLISFLTNSNDILKSIEFREVAAINH